MPVIISSRRRRRGPKLLDTPILQSLPLTIAVITPTRRVMRFPRPRPQPTVLTPPATRSALWASNIIRAIRPTTRSRPARPSVIDSHLLHATVSIVAVSQPVITFRIGIRRPRITTPQILGKPFTGTGGAPDPGFYPDWAQTTYTLAGGIDLL